MHTCNTRNTDSVHACDFLHPKQGTCNFLRPKQGTPYGVKKGLCSTHENGDGKVRAGASRVWVSGRNDQHDGAAATPGTFVAPRECCIESHGHDLRARRLKNRNEWRTGSALFAPFLYRVVCFSSCHIDRDIP